MPQFNVMASSYSYRLDEDVPHFSDEGPCTVMDARCSLCAKGARWIAYNDHQTQFKIIPLQSDLGRALMIHYGVDPDDPLSWLFLDKGRAYTSVDAIIRVGQRLGGIWSGLVILRVLPRFIQDTLYGFIARNRYRFFGQTDLCSLPDEQLQKRLMQ